MEGAQSPPLENEVCYGISFIDQEPTFEFTLKYLIEMYQSIDADDFFNGYFKRLAGTNELQKQIEAGMTEEEIRKTWALDLENFKVKREQYLLYD
jgi:uncharacterized protein YbbC (DUF1343 family)